MPFVLEGREFGAGEYELGEFEVRSVRGEIAWMDGDDAVPPIGCQRRAPRLSEVEEDVWVVGFEELMDVDLGNGESGRRIEGSSYVRIDVSICYQDDVLGIVLCYPQTIGHAGHACCSVIERFAPFARRRERLSM